MLNRKTLERAVYEFLKQDDISADTHIFNYLLYKMAGLELDGTKYESPESYPGFFQTYDREETLTFKLPSGLSIAQLFQLLDFLHIDHNTFKLGEHVTLDPAFVTNELFPRFKQFYQQFKQTKPAEFAQFRIDSKARLESSASDSVSSYAREVMKLIDEMNQPLSATMQSIQKNMLLLLGILRDINSYPTTYKFIAERTADITRLATNPEVTANAELAKKMRMVLESIASYQRYNRVESVIANRNFLKDMETFLRTQQISSGCCDVIEKTLASLAGAQSGLKAKYEVMIGGDKSRLVFAFTDMSEAEGKKVISYLQRKGDETAQEGSGYRRHGSRIPEAAFAMAPSHAYAPRGGYAEPEEVIETQMIETDGKFFYDRVFPEMKMAIANLATLNPAMLAHYQALSAKKLADEAVAGRRPVRERDDEGHWCGTDSLYAPSSPAVFSAPAPMASQAPMASAAPAEEEDSMDLDETATFTI